jgi:gliding motility-associated lipoprotein GldH
LIACDSDRLAEDQVDFATRNWAAQETPQFPFRIHDAGLRYNLYYTVRNTIDYPFARLFVNYQLTDSAGQVLAEKLVTSYLFDVKTGKPNGRSGLGDVYDHREPLLQNFEFRQPGLYYLRLQQFMRTDSLAGVLAVGMRVETAENK